MRSHAGDAPTTCGPLMISRRCSWWVWPSTARGPDALVAIAFRTLLSVGSQGHQVAGEPVTGQYRDPLEGAGFFETVGGAGNPQHAGPRGLLGFGRGVSVPPPGFRAPQQQAVRPHPGGPRTAPQNRPF